MEGIVTVVLGVEHLAELREWVEAGRGDDVLGRSWLARWHDGTPLGICSEARIGDPIQNPLNNQGPSSIKTLFS
jgi:hypothetical protein